MGALTRKEMPSAGDTGDNGDNGDEHSAFARLLRQSVGCPVLPRWRGLVLSLPRYLRFDFAVSPSATHQECSASTKNVRSARMLL
jgi:hypothetical protein